MWREYFGFAGTALAVINGLIAITVALLPMRRSVLKLRLGAAALVLGALAVGATFYSKYRAYVQVERQQSDRAEIRERLENFIAEGRELLGQIRDASANCRRRPPTSGRSGRKSFCATSWASASSPRFRKDADELYGDDAERRRAAHGLLARGAQSRRQSGS